MGIIVQTLLPFLFLGVMGSSMYVVSRSLSEHRCHSREGAAFGFYRHAPFAVLAFILCAILLHGANQALESELVGDRSALAVLAGWVLHRPGPAAGILLVAVLVPFLENTLRP